MGLCGNFTKTFNISDFSCMSSCIKIILLKVGKNLLPQGIEIADLTCGIEQSFFDELLTPSGR